MIDYHFRIIEGVPLKGHFIAGTKDYRVQVKVTRDEQVLFDKEVMVRKNKEGAYPDADALKDKKLSATVQRELAKKLKEYVVKKGK
ncbi:MAG: hypothetical protein Q4B48_08350 [Syntrophomonadaceae bacterium]|nr:hypothetical protein [Syntrophomonadaceae bacterium]